MRKRRRASSAPHFLVLMQVLMFSGGENRIREESKLHCHLVTGAEAVFPRDTAATATDLSADDKVLLWRPQPGTCRS